MTTVCEAGKPTALILLDHGSSRADANRELANLAGRLAESVGSRYLCVEPAHMEQASPSLEEAFAHCVSRGAGRVVVVLFFLAAGVHSTDDIPRMAAEASARHGNIEYVLTTPLGTADEIADLLVSLVEKTVASP